MLTSALFWCSISSLVWRSFKTVKHGVIDFDLLLRWTFMAALDVFTRHFEFLIGWLPFYGLLKMTAIALTFFSSSSLPSYLFLHFIAPHARQLPLGCFGDSICGHIIETIIYIPSQLLDLLLPSEASSSVSRSDGQRRKSLLSAPIEKVTRMGANVGRRLSGKMPKSQEVAGTTMMEVIDPSEEEKESRLAARHVYRAGGEGGKEVMAEEKGGKGRLIEESRDERYAVGKMSLATVTRGSAEVRSQTSAKEAGEVKAMEFRAEPTGGRKGSQSTLHAAGPIRPTGRVRRPSAAPPSIPPPSTLTQSGSFYMAASTLAGQGPRPRQRRTEASSSQEQAQPLTRRK